MALKAGRVGVNPSQVDMAGNVIGGGGDTYTKLEIDQLLGSKVGIGQLEANNKDFYFAYDETSQKYGYKLDGTGDFHPFEEGGSLDDFLANFGIVLAAAGDSISEGSNTYNVVKPCLLYWCWATSSAGYNGVMALENDAISGLTLTSINMGSYTIYYKSAGNTSSVSRNVNGITENINLLNKLYEANDSNLLPRMAKVLLED